MVGDIPSPMVHVAAPMAAPMAAQGMPVPHPQHCFFPYDPNWVPPPILPNPMPVLPWSWFPPVAPWPKVKKIEYHENGTIKSIEYYDFVPSTSVIA
jgi:hypothetical protein